MKKVAFVIPSFSRGGAERVIIRLAEYMNHAKLCEATIITFWHDPNGYAAPVGVRTINLNVPPSPNKVRKIFSMVHRAWLLRKQIQAGSYDRVFSFLFGVHIVSVLTGLPVYVAIRSRLGSKAWHRYLYWFYRRKNVQGVICQTEGLAQEVRAQVSCPVPVIPNPFLIPGDAGDNCADLGMYILAVGRLAAEKNFSLLIRAFVQAQLQPQVKLLIAGIGPERAKLAALISELGVEGRVKLLGLQSDDALDCLYRHAYCQVLSSNNEGFPNVVGEGLSRGVPVIATNCEHGPSEMIVDGENGLLVPVGDSEALASALSRIFSDDVLYGQLQSKTRASMMRFSIEAIAPLWLQ